MLLSMSPTTADDKESLSMSVVKHTIVHILNSSYGEVLFETSIDSEDDAMSIWFIPEDNQGIKGIAIHSDLVINQKPQNTDRIEAREIWNRLVEMGFKTLN